MISVQEALTILQDNMPTPQTEKVLLDDAFECYLSEDIKAPESSPRYTNSAMDGFALKWSDYEKNGSKKAIRLNIIGESQAGIPFAGEVTSGSAVRISTGAMVPNGADTVVRVEDTVEDEGLVTVLEARNMGQDIRYAGEEFCEGDLLFQKGESLGAKELALLAAIGQQNVPVYRQPKVSLLITGTELAPHNSDDIQPHQIRDSNSIMLINAVKEMRAKIGTVSYVKDSLEHTTQAVKDALASDADIIVCSGGVSVGRHDHVKDAAIATGFEVLFWRIKQKPGKPLFVSRLGDKLLFGLPGNPVSAFMCFNNYVRPVLESLQGTALFNHRLTGRVIDRYVNKGKRTDFIRVTVDQKPNDIAVVKKMAQQGSHMLSSIVHADGYIELQPGDIVEQDSLVEVVLFT